jgi:proteasome lid subunit RPN8/RPN11
MIHTLVLPHALCGQIVREATAAYPAECCGLIEGIVSDEGARAVACHPIRNVAKANDRFELDPAQQIRLLKALRGTGREIIGCYHSHPNGRAEPSARDLAGAADENFLWLIAAGDILAAYVHSAAVFHPVRLA